MEIEINENETYNINLPNKINIIELQEILNRLNIITKLINRDILSFNVNQAITKTSKQANIIKIRKPYTLKNPTRRCNLRLWCDNKLKSVELFKLQYFGEWEQKREIAKALNYDWESIQKGFNALKTRFDIKPEEVGLFRFPNKHDGTITIRTLKNPNFNYTYNKNKILEILNKKTEYQLREKNNKSQEQKTEDINEIEQEALNELNKLNN